MSWSCVLRLSVRVVKLLRAREDSPLITRCHRILYERGSDRRGAVRVPFYCEILNVPVCPLTVKDTMDVPGTIGTLFP
jgi:hypothetical protein